MSIDKQRESNGSQLKQESNKGIHKLAFLKSLSQFLKDGDGTREDWQRIRDENELLMRRIKEISSNKIKT